jgi:DNA-binding MarR family transcriptional regulator
MPLPPRRRAADVLATIAPLVTRFTERVLAEHDPPLTPAQLLALRAVAGGAGSAHELARRAAVSEAAVSQLVIGLEERGLIARDRVPGDRRRLTMRLTPAGIWALESADRRLADMLADVVAAVPPAEAATLGRLLAGVESAFADRPPPPRPPRSRPSRR